MSEDRRLHESTDALLQRIGSRAPYKPIWWCGAALDELKELPAEVMRGMGVALRAAQGGKAHPNAKPYTTDKHKGWSVLEVVGDIDTDTYRLVYTVAFSDVVFVLCAFQKKSKKGRATPKQDKALVESRFRMAKATHGNPPEDLAARMQRYRVELATFSPVSKPTPSRKRS